MFRILLLDYYKIINNINNILIKNDYININYYFLDGSYWNTFVIKILVECFEETKLYSIHYMGYITITEEYYSIKYKNLYNLDGLIKYNSLNDLLKTIKSLYLEISSINKEDELNIYDLNIIFDNNINKRKFKN